MTAEKREGSGWFERGGSNWGLAKKKNQRGTNDGWKTEKKVSWLERKCERDRRKLGRL